MISHIFLGTNDIDTALRFYEPLCALLDLPLRFKNDDRPWAGWTPPGGGRPYFLIGRPHDREPASAGNGTMIALTAATRSIVEQAHGLALANGGTDEGAPGLRPHYHASYYGAYFRDPDGNKLCVVCHAPEED